MLVDPHGHSAHRRKEAVRRHPRPCPSLLAEMVPIDWSFPTSKLSLMTLSTRSTLCVLAALAWLANVAPPAELKPYSGSGCSLADDYFVNEIWAKVAGGVLPQMPQGRGRRGGFQARAARPCATHRGQAHRGAAGEPRRLRPDGAGEEGQLNPAAPQVHGQNETRWQGGDEARFYRTANPHRVRATGECAARRRACEGRGDGREECPAVLQRRRNAR